MPSIRHRQTEAAGAGMAETDQGEGPINTELSHNSNGHNPNTNDTYRNRIGNGENENRISLERENIMNLTAKTIRFGLPALFILGIVAGLAFWVGETGRTGGAVGSVGDTAMIRGWVDVTHRDADGNILWQNDDHNTVVASLITAAADRVGITAQTTASSDMYDWIQACSADASGVSCSISDLDTTDATEDNPLDGTGVAGAAGEYVSAVTFLCSSATSCAAIQEIQLVSGDPADGVSGTIGAWQDVNVTLSGSDTLTVTWTVDIG